MQNVRYAKVTSNESNFIVTLFGRQHKEVVVPFSDIENKFRKEKGTDLKMLFLNIVKSKFPDQSSIYLDTSAADNKMQQLAEKTGIEYS